MHPPNWPIDPVYAKEWDAKQRDAELATFAAWLERRQANRDYRASYYGPDAQDVSRAEEASRWEYMNSAWRAWCVACDELGEFT